MPLALVHARQAGSFDALVRDVAEAKSAAASARGTAVDHAVPAPKIVFEDACTQLVAATSGYKYLKSARRLRRKEGDFVCDVAIGTSPHNVRGALVALDLAANVRSRDLEAWRAREGGIRTNDFVAGGMLHLVRGESMPIQWNVADDALRADVIAEVAQVIEVDIEPWFASFADRLALFERLRREDVPALFLADAIELALCYAQRDVARIVLQRFLAARSDLVPEIERAIATEQAKPAVGHGYARQIAWLATRHDLAWR